MVWIRPATDTPDARGWIDAQWRRVVAAAAAKADPGATQSAGGDSGELNEGELVDDAPEEIDVFDGEVTSAAPPISVFPAATPCDVSVVGCLSGGMQDDRLYRAATADDENESPFLAA